MQTPLQLAPPGQVWVHELLEQAAPLWQALSRAPQLLELEPRSMQAVVGPSALKAWPGDRLPGQLLAHDPLTQTCPVAHAVPQLPQCLAEVCRETQSPPQRALSWGQEAVHVPPTHTCPAPQGVPQAPQCKGLFSGSTQPEAQRVRPLAQVPVAGKST